MPFNDDFSKYMNPPVETDGKAYKEFHNGKYYICCPYCGKRQFPINENTLIKGMAWKCKGSNCKKEFEVEI